MRNRLLLTADTRRETVRRVLPPALTDRAASGARRGR